MFVLGVFSRTAIVCSAFGFYINPWLSIERDVKEKTSFFLLYTHITYLPIIIMHQTTRIILYYVFLIFSYTTALLPAVLRTSLQSQCNIFIAVLRLLYYRYIPTHQVPPVYFERAVIIYV